MLKHFKLYAGLSVTGIVLAACGGGGGNNFFAADVETALQGLDPSLGFRAAFAADANAEPVAASTVTFTLEPTLDPYEIDC